MDSPELYQRRKKIKIPPNQPRPEFVTNSLSYHDRPHITLPELAEDYPNVWVPDPPPPPVIICEWDDPAAIWDDTFYFDCGENE